MLRLRVRHVKGGAPLIGNPMAPVLSECCVCSTVLEMSAEGPADDGISVEESQCHHWFDFICGIPKAHSRSEERPEVMEDQRQQFLTESPRWSAVLNVHAAIAMTVMAFLTGYYH